MVVLKSWFRGIKGKLFFSSFLPVLGLATVFWIAHMGMVSLTGYLENSHKHIIPNIQALSEMRQARNNYGYNVWYALGTTNPTDRPELLKAARKAAADYEKAMNAYESTPFTEEMEKVYADAKAAKTEYLALLAKVIELIETNTPENMTAAKDILETKAPAYAKIMAEMSAKSTEYYNRLAQEDDKSADNAVATANRAILVVTILASLLIFGLLAYIANQISKAVGSIGEKLSSASSRVTTSVEQLNEAGNGLSQSSTQAAASLEETVAALEEMSSMVQMNSDNAKQAAALSSSSRDAAESGEREIQTLIQSMTAISQSSRKIEEIISVIDDIAFQTNLLALNAAVEAARAGEQGKGFAVVAEAVRSLAQRSAVAAKDITVLIKDSVAQISDGSKIADKSGTVLSNIVNSVKKVSDLNNEIAAASSEQTTGIQQISKAMNQLDQSSQSNAASAEEIAATSGEINNLAQDTQNLTAELNSVVMGQTKAASNPPALETKKSVTVPKHKGASNKKTEPLPRHEEKSNVVAMKSPSLAKKQSEEMIPFDEDDGRSKVGTTDGF